MKVDQIKTRKEDNIRFRVLNGLIHKAVAEMMATCEVNQELYDLKLEICKASAKASTVLSSSEDTLKFAWQAKGASLGVVMLAGVLLHCFSCGRAQQDEALDSSCRLRELCHCCI